MKDISVLSKEAFLFREVFKNLENEEKKQLAPRSNTHKAHQE
jgi:hypothetical protein